MAHNLGRRDDDVDCQRRAGSHLLKIEARRRHRALDALACEDARVLLRDAQHGRSDLVTLVPEEGGKLLLSEAVRHLIRLEKRRQGEWDIIGGQKVANLAQRARWHLVGRRHMREQACEQIFREIGGQLKVCDFLYGRLYV